jgi:pimeloyl-ACP methyl ester carboxylesterase
MWIHSAGWQPWIDLLEGRGYSVTAPGWPGDAATVAETREHPETMNDVGIGEIVDHYAALIGTPEVKPVLIGHSFGGLVAEELLADGHGAAAVAIDPAGIKGVKALPYAQLNSAFPVLESPANRHRGVSLNAKQFHYAFGNMLTAEESEALHDAWSIPGPGKALFQEGGANFSRHSPAKVDTHLAERGPLLLTSGPGDHTVPMKVTKEVFKMYQKGPADTEMHIFEGHGHSLTWTAAGRTSLRSHSPGSNPKDSEAPLPAGQPCLPAPPVVEYHTTRCRMHWLHPDERHQRPRQDQAPAQIQPGSGTIRIRGP